MPEPIVIATWPFGTVAVKAAWPLLESGQTALDAVVAGAQAVEDDPAVNSVGYGGLADGCGNVTLDACVMEGTWLACGGVAGVSNVRHVSALARCVLEHTPHVLLVGDGAQQFALQKGFPLEILHTPESIAQWNKLRAERAKPAAGALHQSLPLWPNPGAGGPDDHDTVTVLARDQYGHLAGCCTTSGLAHRLPGRVGDSPLIGAGLYVDDEAGAAGATGVGEEIIRVHGSSLIVEFMRSGQSAQAACENAVRRVHDVARRRGFPASRLAFLAIDRDGNPGACCTADTKFQYAIGTAGRCELVTPTEV
jgi:isoaspartyl peptidase/L-asparaginase-like protein (Ntn-hydrolase superfamily)